MANAEDMPGYPINESDGSKNGRGFVGPEGTRIANEGEVHLNMVGPQGPMTSTFQVAKVTRPLMSIAKICDRGHSVTFHKLSLIHI